MTATLPGTRLRLAVTRYLLTEYFSVCGTEYGHMNRTGSRKKNMRCSAGKINNLRGQLPSFQMEQPLFWIACAAQKCCLPKEPTSEWTAMKEQQTLKYGNIHTHQPGKMVLLNAKPAVGSTFQCTIGIASCVQLC